MAVQDSWTRIVDWCRANAPITFSGIRPPRPVDERSSPTWDSIGAMLDDVAASLDTGDPCDEWIPVVRGGRLEWELEP